MLYLILSGKAQGWTGSLGQNGWGPGYLGEYNVVSAFVFEVVATFLFLVCILGVTHPFAPTGFAGLAIGLTLVAIHLVGINITGTSVNPARSIGPALVGVGSNPGAVAQLWLFIIAPLIGAGAAGFLYRERRFPGRRRRRSEPSRPPGLASARTAGEKPAMLHISALTYRLGERLLIDNASAALPSGAHVGLVGRNGAGKTTLFRLIRGELSPESGAVIVPKGARVGSVEQEAPGGAESLIDFVLAADVERAALIAEADIASDPERIAEIQTRLVDIDAHTAPARAARILKGLGFDEAAQGRPLVGIFRRLAHARRARRGAVLRARPAAARRADQLSRPRRGAVAHRLSEELSGDDPRHQP